jgi:O-antigen ligase
MPQNIKSLIVVLLLSLPIFYIAEKALANLIPPVTMRARRNTWLLAACLPFVTPSIWLYFSAIGIIVIYQARKEDSSLPLFALLLMACIPLNAEIPGIAGIRYLFDLSYYRLIILALLVPDYIKKFQLKGKGRQPNKITDWLMLGYPLLLLILYFPLNSLTNNIRYAFLTVIDVAIPYLLITRSRLSSKQIIEIILMFALGVSVLAAISIVEIGLSWPIFNVVMNVWDRPDPLMNFLMREGMFRAQTTAGHSLVMGYAAMVGLAAWTASEVIKPNRIIQAFFFMLLLAGLIASLARGAWLGCAIMVIIYILLTKNPIVNVTKLLLLVGLVVAAGMLTPFGTKIVSLMPFIGTAEQGNIEYRQVLFNFAVEILKEYPVFGHPYFLSFMEGARNGEGLIDLVNIYINVALQSGLVGLSLFTGAFLATAWQLLAIAKSRVYESIDTAAARTLLASLAGILFTISTLSNIASVPYIYWFMLAMGSALVRAVSDKTNFNAELHPKQNLTATTNLSAAT